MSYRERRRRREGFRFGRLVMVLSSISPLFVLWGIKGASAVPDLYLIPSCVFAVVVPALFVWWRVRTAKRDKDSRELTVGSVEGYGHHVLTYIFAMLLPFYRQDIATLRDVLAMGAALAFVIVIFWNLNLHYINLAFILGRYRTYVVHPPADGNPHSGIDDFILVTRRTSIRTGEGIIAYRISDKFYLESREE